jgi:hypothetical protein
LTASSLGVEISGLKGVGFPSRCCCESIPSAHQICWLQGYGLRSGRPYIDAARNHHLQEDGEIQRAEVTTGSWSDGAIRRIIWA